MLYKGETTQVPPVYSVEQEKLNIPNLIFGKNDPEEIKALEYSFDGKYYYFSNEEGHKVYSYDKRSCRPMTKREFKNICTQMLDNLENYGEQESLILSEIEKLDFSIGHANSTFEVVCSCSGLSKIGALALNLGTGRYLYNQDANTVFHIDHSKLINGTMMKSPEKDEIIRKITSSKTMTKKINQVLQS